MSGAPHILVIKLGALGDFIQALGPMAAIRKHHPHDKITLLTTKPYEELAQSCGYFNDVWVDDRPKWHDIGGWIHLRRALNAGHFSRVYDLQNNDRTSFYFRLFFPQPEWVGAAKGASHRNGSSDRSAGRAFDGHAQTLALAGIKNVTIDRLEWMLDRGGFEGLRQPYILIVPGASPRHPQKRWPAAHYAAFCKKILSRGYQPVLLGGDAEKTIAKEIAASAGGILDLTAKTTLSDIPMLARGAIGAIGNDTGPMHLVSPTGCPSIVLFSGKSNPVKHAPIGRNVITMQKNDLSDLKPDEVWRAFAAQHSIV